MSMLDQELMFDRIGEYRRRKQREEDDAEVQREVFARMEQDYLEQQEEMRDHEY